MTYIDQAPGTGLLPDLLAALCGRSPTPASAAPAPTQPTLVGPRLNQITSGSYPRAVPGALPTIPTAVLRQLPQVAAGTSPYASADPGLAARLLAQGLANMQ